MARRAGACAGVGGVECDVMQLLAIHPEEAKQQQKQEALCHAVTQGVAWNYLERTGAALESAAR